MLTYIYDSYICNSYCHVWFWKHKQASPTMCLNSVVLCAVNLSGSPYLTQEFHA